MELHFDFWVLAAPSAPPTPKNESLYAVSVVDMAAFATAGGGERENPLPIPHSMKVILLWVKR